MNYHKLTEAELDMYLLNAFYPKKKERINFSDIDNFRYMILNLIQEHDLSSEFVECLLGIINIDKKEFSDKDKNKDKDNLAIHRHLFTIINIDIKFLKMSALKAFHDNKEHLAL